MHLGDRRAVLVIDETGFLKQGTKSVGVKRQYSGTAGRIENRQIGVFLASAAPEGHVLVDRELYLPREWADDAVRRREAGVPKGVFRHQTAAGPADARRAQAAGVPAAWMTGDTIDGGDRRLRVWLEQHEFSRRFAYCWYLWGVMRSRCHPAPLSLATIDCTRS